MKKRNNLKLIFKFGIFMLTAVVITATSSEVKVANASSGDPVEIHVTSVNNDFSNIATGISDIDNGSNDINSFGTPLTEGPLNSVLPAAVSFSFDGLGVPTEASTPYLPLTLDGGRTTVSLADDQVSSDIALPFTVSMFGRDNDTIRIGSNGFIYLNQTSVSSFDSRCCSGTLMSSVSGTNDHMIAGGWTDMFPPGGGEISYETFGSYPDRVFVVSFDNISPCCDASGGNSWQIQLYEVAGPPSAPAAITDLASTPGDQQVTLTWSAPNDHGDPLTSYEVHYSNDGFVSDDQICVTTDCTDLTTGATITGLTNNIFYTFKVYSYNSIGISPISNYTYATPFAPGPPDAITDLQATSGNGRVTLTWTAPYDNNDPLISYEVHYSNDGFVSDDQTCAALDCEDLTTGGVVTGLTNGTLYSFQVYAYNSLGISPVSNTATATPADLNGPPAQWPTPSNPADTVISNETQAEYTPRAVRTNDGNYIVFFDHETNIGNLIYAQKVNATTGSTIWASPVQVSSQQEIYSTIESHWVASSDNGAFIAFARQSNNEFPPAYDIYVQKLDSAGNVLWGASGVNPTTDGSTDIAERNPLMVSDGAGGVYVAWDLTAGFFTTNIHITHLDSTGAIAADWNTTGTDDYRTIQVDDGLSSSEHLGLDMWLQADGNIAVPYYKTTGTIFSSTITAEMIVVQAQGGPSSSSILLSTPASSIGQFRAYPYGGYGAFATYTTNGDVYAQRVDDSWNPEWGTNGVIASSADGNYLSGVTDGSGGLIIVWSVYEGADGGGTYGTHVLSNGTLDASWGGSDIVIAPDGDGDAQTLNNAFNVVSDGENGAFVAFNSDLTQNIYLQQLKSDGTLGIAGTGHINGSSDDGVDSAQFLINDGDNGAVLFWMGYNNSTDYDIYGQHIIPGAAEGAPDAIDDLSGTPGDGQVTLNWTAPLDNGFPITDYVIQYNDGSGYQTFSDGTSTSTTTIVTGLANFTTYTFRVYAVNVNGQSETSNIVTITPVPCGSTRSNEEIDDNPLTTVSDQCIGVSVSSGGLSLPYVPDSFTFPRKFSSSSSQDSFSNDNAATRNVVDVSIGSEDILTASDLTGSSAGFNVTVTASNFTNGTDLLPLRNLYVATTAPDTTSLNTLNSDLNGTPNNPNQLVYATGSSGLDLTSNTATTGSLNTVTSYTTDGVSFDANNDNTSDIITLMSAPNTGAHMLSASQALSFYLNIPASQPSGNYSILFTVDIMSLP